MFLLFASLLLSLFAYIFIDWSSNIFSIFLLFSYIIVFKLLFKHPLLDFLMLLRILILSIPGLLCLLVINIPGDYYLHYLAFFVQTPLVVKYVALSSSIALSGVAFALICSPYIFPKIITVPVFLATSTISKPKFCGFINYLFSLLFSLIVFARLGAGLLTTSYSLHKAFTTPIDGVLSLLANLFAGICIFYIFKMHSLFYKRCLLILLLLNYILLLLTGGRVEYIIPFLTLLFLVYNSFKRRKLLTITQFSSKITISFKRIILSSFVIYFLFFALTLIGKFRTSTSRIFSEYVSDIIFNPFNILIVNYSDKQVIYLETLNHVIGSFYSFVYQSLYQNYLLMGESYFHFIPRLLPKTLRPDDLLILEWETPVDGQLVTQGSNFELAEAFANFHLLGVFVIPFLITIIILWYKNISLRLPWFYGAYICIYFLSLRIYWYQTFALFRFISITALFLLILSSLQNHLYKDIPDSSNKNSVL